MSNTNLDIETNHLQLFTRFSPLSFRRCFSKWINLPFKNQIFALYKQLYRVANENKTLQAILLF